jgi:uncharacterized protein YjiS (DUF1127 family)
LNVETPIVAIHEEEEMSLSTIAHAPAQGRVRSQSRAAIEWPLSFVRSLVAWLSRVAAASREFEQLARLSEYELKDIGLTRSDIGDVTALPVDASPTEFLAARVKERRCAR